MKTLFVCSFLLLTFQVHSQLKVSSGGLVGIGTTTPNNGFNLTLGNTSKDGFFHSRYGYHFRAGQAGPTNAVVGSSSDKIDFWYSNHNVVYAQSYGVASDSTLKRNIQPLTGSMDLLMKLRPKSYDFISTENHTDYTFGFVAQDVKKIMPHLVDKSRGVLLIDYDQIIPVLTSAIQEQQNTIENLQEQIDELKDKIDQEDQGPDLMETNENSNESSAKLHQNKPNPFHENTVLQYELPQNYSSASIMVFNMSGSLLKTYPISGNGTGELTIALIPKIIFINC